MAKLGRPFTYQSDDEKPVTLSLRVPRALAERLKRYASEHRQSVTALLLEGLHWRLEQGADLQEQSGAYIPYPHNTAMPHIQELVNAAVQAALATGYGPSTRSPIRAAAATPPDDIQHDTHTDVLQERALSVEASARGTVHRLGTMRARILDLLHQHPAGLTAEEIRVYLRLEKPLGDVLQGMRRQNKVTTRGSGKATRYYIL